MIEAKFPIRTFSKKGGGRFYFIFYFSGLPLKRGNNKSKYTNLKLNKNIHTKPHTMRSYSTKPANTSFYTIFYLLELFTKEVIKNKKV
jgi:hypothetical protein